MGFKPEVTTAADNGKFNGNALVFATESEAQQYVIDLAMRWTLVVDTRVVETEDSPNRRITDGTMETI